MIYEVSNYDLKPGSMAEVEKRLQEAGERRKSHAGFAASFRTEIGPLEQVVQVWTFENKAERERVVAAEAREKAWPPEIDSSVLARHTHVLESLPYSPALTAGKLGPFFEIRTYTYAPGKLPNMIENWEKALPKRLSLSPLWLLGCSEGEGRNTWMHIWPYPTLNQRTDVRNHARDTGVWPPSVLAVKEGRQNFPLAKMENKIVMPASFSPVQ